MKPQNLRNKFAKPDTEFMLLSPCLATHSANSTHRNTTRGLDDKKLLFSESF